MNKIGIHFAYWSHSWNIDFLSSIFRARKIGFDILEVNPLTVLKMGKLQRQRLKGEAENQGVELTYCLGLSKDFDVASPLEQVRQAGVQLLQQLAQMIKEMGGTGLSGVLYGCWPASLQDGETEKNAALERSVESMKEVLKPYEDNDLFLIIEVVNRFEQYLINTAQEAVSYIERLGSDNCKILLDTFHMNIEEDSFEQAIKTAGRKLGHFHLGETNRRPPGKGRIPWNEIMLALRGVEYLGPLVMEPFLMPGGDVGRDIRVYRNLQEGADLDEEARTSCNFVRSKLGTSN